jgi:hypothetical protein
VSVKGYRQLLRPLTVVMLDFIFDPISNVLVKSLAPDDADDFVTYPVLREFVTQVLPSLLYSGLITNFLFIADIVECETSNVDHPVNLCECGYTTIWDHDDL